MRHLSRVVVRTVTGIISFFSTVIPILLAFVPDDKRAPIIGAQCELTEQQLAGVQAAMINRNASCSYNVSLEDLLAR